MCVFISFFFQNILILKNVILKTIKQNVTAVHHLFGWVGAAGDQSQVCIRLTNCNREAKMSLFMYSQWRGRRRLRLVKFSVVFYN